jgi:N-acetylglucosamine-6-phosphate deacetylase
MLWLHDAVLADPEAAHETAGSLLIDGDRIAARFAPGERPPDGVAQRVSLGGARLAPGFVDVHFHGELAACDADDALAALRRASALLARHGVSAFLATTVAWPAAELHDRVERIAAALDAGDWPGAVPIGVHLEGPWIRSEAAGAQPPDGIRPYDPREGDALFARLGSRLRLVTLAPELPNARRLEADLARRGVAIAVGHTLATAGDLAASIANGACHATHLFNAMGSRSHRAPAGDDATPGVAELVLREGRLGCDLIADGAHVHPDWLRIAARAKGDRLVLISDRIDPPAQAAAASAWLGADRLASDGVAWRLPDGRLAGSLLTLDAALRNVAAWRVMDPRAALAACTVRPARLLGIEREHGTLRPGARADLVALAADGSVLQTWVAGRCVFPASGAPRQ